MQQAPVEAQWAEEFTIGQRPGDRIFSQLVAMEVAAGGDLVALDAGERAVTVWDAGGNEIHRWGRQGEGPGEFTNPVGMALAGRRVAVADGLSVAVFDIGGDALETYALPGPQLALRPVFDAEGRVLVLAFDVIEGELRLLRLADGEVLWRVAAQNLLEQRLFRPRPVLAALSAGRVVLGLRAEYALDVVDSSPGDVLGTLGRDLVTRPLTGAFLRKVRDYLMDPGSAPSGWSSVLGDRGRPGLSREDVDAIEFPDLLPSVVHVFRGPPGETVWVRRGLGVDDALAPSVDPPDALNPMWDLFDAETHEYRTTVSLPGGFIPYAGDAARLAGIQTSPLDVQTVRVLRFNLPSAGDVMSPR